MDCLDTHSLPIHWSPRILNIKPSTTIPEPAFKPCLPWGLHGLSSPEDPPASSCALPTLLSFILSNLTFSPSLSCFPSLLRDLPVPGGVVELLPVHSPLPPSLGLDVFSSALLLLFSSVSPSPCYYLEFLPPLPLPLAASSCSLCALDSFVALFRNTL